MAITVTDRGTVNESNPPEVLTVVSGAFSPSASHLILSLLNGFQGYTAGAAFTDSDTIADTAGGSWVEDILNLNTAAEGLVRVAHRQLGTAPGSSKTVTTTNTGLHHDVWNQSILEVAGHNATTPIPSGQKATDTTSGATLTPSLPHAPASTSLVVCGICSPSLGSAPPTPSGFTVINSIDQPPGDGLAMFYKIGSGPQSVSWTSLPPTSFGYQHLGFIIEIQQASGGGGGPADPGLSLTDTFNDVGGGVWTQATGVTGDGAEVDIWYRRIGTAPVGGSLSSGAVTLHSANSTQGRELTVLEMAHRNTDNPIPPGQSAVASVTSAGMTASLPGAPASDSVVVAGAISRGDSSAPGVPAGHIASENASTGGDGYEAGYNPAGAGQSAAYSGLATTRNLAAIAEIRKIGSGSGGGGGAYYVSNSTWNTPIPANATFVDEPSLRSGGGWFNADAFGTPFIRSSPTDREVTVTYPNNSWGWAGTTVTLRIPDNAYAATGSDGSLSVLDPSTNLAHDFWQFARATGTSATATAAAYARSNVVTEDGWSSAPGRGAGIHASGSALIAGAILNNELTAGINHTCAVAIRKNLATGGFIFPSINGDGGGGAIPNGQRLGIPPGVPMPGGLNLQEQNVWKSAQKYGCYVIDTADGAQSTSWWGDVVSVPQSDIDALINPITFATPGLTAVVNALRLVR